MLKSVSAVSIAPGVALGGQAGVSVEPFQFVSGRGYEGAIVPASRVPDWYKDSGVNAVWTPTPADVTAVEARLVEYLKVAATEPLQASPPVELRADHPPYSLEGLRALVGTIGEFKRQYMGLLYGQERHVLVRGFNGTFNKDWRNRVVTVIDGGCGYWYFEFDMERQRPIRFGCQSDA
jgi:hypothetical protein